MRCVHVPEQSSQRLRKYTRSSGRYKNALLSPSHIVFPIKESTIFHQKHKAIHPSTKHSSIQSLPASIQLPFRTNISPTQPNPQHPQHKYNGLSNVPTYILPLRQHLQCLRLLKVLLNPFNPRSLHTRRSGFRFLRELSFSRNPSRGRSSCRPPSLHPRRVFA
jgi:hypothetical protein